MAKSPASSTSGAASDRCAFRATGSLRPRFRGPQHLNERPLPVNAIQPYQFGEATAVQLTETTTQTRGDRSREWLALFFETAKAAEILASTDFVPTSMKGKPAQVAAAMMKGYELDIDPLDALGNIFSAHGRVGFYAEFMRRRIFQAGHEIRFVETNDTRALVEGRRRGEEEWTRVVFTAQQAKNAKIDLGGYPEDKLVARATSRLCKRMFPEVLSGAAIAEDLMDEPAQVTSVRVVSDVAEDLPKPGTMQRKRRTRRTTAEGPAAPAAETVTADAPPLPGDEPATEPRSTTAQQQKLAILLDQTGVTDRDGKLAYLGEQFGRPFASSKELTRREASELIDYLESPIEPDSVAEATDDCALPPVAGEQ
ncbi:hypothetical protein F5X71_00280 [Nocardia brasiliensis]|uniref:Uncharacterized protein n=1 Tax=Nocardia brasiliensis TaxID=37326 RepID=A0A6G9XJ86_NOCBR|nr:hypothetical protein [Nocardia brasiliensis]QIS00971.1 hypothetical protein F5X71_00280 [Nocardia brasiliensis]